MNLFYFISKFESNIWHIYTKHIISDVKLYNFFNKAETKYGLHYAIWKHIIIYEQDVRFVSLDI